jgi:hypothetical protein
MEIIDKYIILILVHELIFYDFTSLEYKFTIDVNNYI